MEGVSGRERCAIERFAIDEHAAPLAMPPELQLGDRPLAFVFRQEGERLFETRGPEGGVDSAEAAIEVGSELPA
jgi:hypothetical protein